MMEESGDEIIWQMGKILCKVRLCQTWYKTQDCRCDLQTIRGVLPSSNHMCGSNGGGVAVVSSGTDLLSNRKAIPAAHICSAPRRKHFGHGVGGPEGRYSLPTKVGEYSVFMVRKKMDRSKRTVGKSQITTTGEKKRENKETNPARRLHEALLPWLEPPDLHGTCQRVSLGCLCALCMILPALLRCTRLQVARLAQRSLPGSA